MSDARTYWRWAIWDARLLMSVRILRLRCECVRVSVGLQSTQKIDDWFVEKPPQFAMRPRFPVVARLIQQVKDFNRLVNAAIAVIGITAKFCVDLDWGPLLAAAFSDGSGMVKTEPQRRFLRALVKKSELWDSTCGNAFKWFKQAGLPYDREACAKKIEEP